ncbi:hypothetical protein HK096_001871, partial [Nowakowskiella sp. JEL0078]
MQKKNGNPVRFKQALKALLAATNPYGSVKDDTTDDGGSTDCCICIGPIGPYQALFVAPCSHCYHFKCISSLIHQTPMFQCPLCRQVANLTASVSMESLGEDDLDVEKTENEYADKTDGKDSESGSEHSLSPQRESVGIVENVVKEKNSLGLVRLSTSPALNEASRSKESLASGTANLDFPKRGRMVSGSSTPDGTSSLSPGKRRSSITSKINVLLGRKSNNHNEEHLIIDQNISKKVDSISETSSTVPKSKSTDGLN